MSISRKIIYDVADGDVFIDFEIFNFIICINKYQ